MTLDHIANHKRDEELLREAKEAIEGLYYWILQNYMLGPGEPQPRLAKSRATIMKLEQRLLNE